jgi:hypothetical protein
MSGDLSLFQTFLMDQVNECWSKHQHERTPMMKEAVEYMQAYQGSNNMAALKQEHVDVLCAVGQEREAATQFVDSLFVARDGDVIGIRKTCVSMFSFEGKSMWRGTPPNANVRKIARNIVVRGFGQDSIIASRTLDMKIGGRPDVSFHLLLGDGSARAVAACIVWAMLVRSKNSIPAGDMFTEKLVMSLLAVTVNFELHGTGSPKEALLAQCSRQNQAAAVLPVQTLQWVGMVKEYTGLPIGGHPCTTATLLKVIEDIVSMYNQHPEIEAYDKDVVPDRKKRRGAGRKAVVTQDEDRDIGLRIGRRRLMAMKAFLSGATDAVYDELNNHLCIVGDYKASVVSDDLLQLKWLYPGSKIPKEHMPTEAELATRDAVAEISLRLIPESSAREEVRFDVALSAEDFHLMFTKLIKVYESDIEGLDSHEAKIKCRPDQEGFLMCRKIIQFWSQAIEPCARKDLSKEDYELFKKMVLTTQGLDKEIAAVIDRVPKFFHMGLMPSVAGEDAEELVMTGGRVTAAQGKAEVALFEVFEAELQEDWKLVSLAALGQSALKELLAWLENRHRRAQSNLGCQLVSAYCKNFFPLCDMPSWEKVSGQISLLCQTWAAGTGIMRAIVVMDFNVPGSRDSLKMQGMCASAASIAQNIGPSNTVILAWMPSCSKDGGTTSAFDDESTIQVALSKAGFKRQERIMMMLDMPASQHAMVHAMDWFMTGRMCYFEAPGHASKDNFFMINSELARTNTVRQVGMMPEPGELLDAANLEADEDLNHQHRSAEAAEKCAQRGVDVCMVQMKALLSKTLRQQASSSWIQREDKTIVIDFHPHVGDRALVSYELIKESGGSLGELHHIIVAVGKGRAFKHASYAAERVACHAAGQWIGESLTLSGADGHPVRPVRDAGKPTVDELKLYPGSAEALAGVNRLPLQACCMVGNKIKIRPDKLAPLAHVCPELVRKIESLSKMHSEQYESAFSGLVEDKNQEQHPILDDHRAPTLDEEVPPELEELMTFESLAALKSKAKIETECKSFAKGCTMFMDDKNMVYLMAVKDDIIIKAGEMLGGIGGGHIVDRDVELVKAVPWSFSKGDKTWVQMAKDKDNPDNDDGDKSKFTSGTLYSVLRELESKATKPIKLTSFGEVLPTTAGGQQQYNFKCPESAENHRCMDYILTAGKAGAKITNQNFFGPLVTRDADMGAGVLRTTWRLQFDLVAHTLKPNKVHVTSSVRIELPKGQPVRVAWPA